MTGYDDVGEMAAKGHVSLSFDNLGYGDSDIPDGNAICLGSEADIVHQVIAALRTGTFDDGDGDGLAPSYARVALVGHSLGGIEAMAEAISYHDIDALATIDIANEGLPATFLAPPVSRLAAVCARGGEAKRAGAPSGYAFGFNSDEFHSPFMYNTDTAVIDAMYARYERDACGVIESVGAGLVANHLLLSTVTVPVLLVFGDPGAGWAPGTADAERAHYVSSSDVRVAMTPECGHDLMLCRPAPAFRSTMDGWLAGHGF